MRPFLALVALPLALVACTSEDATPSVVVDTTPETIVADSEVVFDDPIADPLEPATPLPTVADAPPSAAPAQAPATPNPPAAPPVAPEATHTMDDGMTMDGHTVDDGMPMDHSPIDHAHDDGQ